MVSPETNFRLVPVADGGEGTLAAVLNCGFADYPISALGPLREPVETRIGIRHSSAVVELAEICGWSRLGAAGPQPMRTGTEGVGKAISAALDAGCSDLILAVGGSVSSDAGLGMLSELGAQALDRWGRQVEPGGIGLALIRKLDLTGMDQRLASTRIRVAADVSNPLLGPEGAARRFASQKGASPDDVELIELGFERFAAAVATATGQDIARMVGGGAAGGVAAGAAGVLGAEIVSGAELVSHMLDLQSAIDKSSIVITGEGRWDEQTFSGKAPGYVTAVSHKRGVPVVAVAGSFAIDRNALGVCGIVATAALTDYERDLHRCMRGAKELLEHIGSDLASRMPDMMGVTS